VAQPQVKLRTAAFEPASTLKAPKPFDAAVEAFNTMVPASLHQRQRLPHGEDRAF
jgi:hypothetical protein